MQAWLLYSFLALFGFSGIYICLKMLADNGLKSIMINFWFFTLTGIGFFLLSIIKKENALSFPKASIPILGCLIIFALFGNYFSIKAFETVPNAGYSTAIIGCAVLILTVFSYFFMGAELSMLKFIGILICVIGASLIALG